jgi:hypothetical protein
MKDPEKQMLCFDGDASVLRRFVTSEEEHSSGTFGVSLEHKERWFASSSASTYSRSWL